MCTRRYAYFDEVKIKWHSALFVPALPYYCHVQPSYRNSCLVPTLYVSSLPPPTLSPYSRRHYSHFVLSAFAPFSFFLPFGCLPLLPRHRALCILFVTLVKGAAPSFKSLSLSLSLSFSLWPRSELHVLDSPWCHRRGNATCLFSLAALRSPPRVRVRSFSPRVVVDRKKKYTFAPFVSFDGEQRSTSSDFPSNASTFLWIFKIYIRTVVDEILKTTHEIHWSFDSRDGNCSELLPVPEEQGNCAQDLGVCFVLAARVLRFKTEPAKWRPLPLLSSSPSTSPTLLMQWRGKQKSGGAAS